MSEPSTTAPAPTGLPDRAKLFLFATGAAAIAVAGVALTHQLGEDRGWPAFLFLVAAASITQLFAFHTIRNQVFHTTPLFFVAGAVLLAPQYAVLLPLISHIGDWIKQRYAWYIQTFNILNFTLAVMSAWWAARLVTNHWLVGRSTAWAVGGVAAAVVYVVINNAGFAIILSLARGHRVRSILNPQVLAADAALAALGITFASFWRSDPWLLPIAIAPLFLLHQALHLPQLQEEARVDAKTDLYNARHFADGLEQELRRAQRFGRPLSVILADLDLLRNINSSYGHLAGDAVLRGIADVIRAHVRAYDVGARLGGEEFAIMLPETTREDALAIAEQIREAVAATPFYAENIDEHIAATVSVGVASFPDDGVESVDLVHAADLAAYRAKLNGRNRVVVASPEPLLLPIGRVAAVAGLPEKRPEPPEPEEHETQPWTFPFVQQLRPGVSLIGGIGIAAGALGALFGTSEDLVALLAVAVFVAFTHGIALQLDHGSVSVSAIGLLAGAGLVGFRAALPLALTAALVDWLLRRFPLSDILLDAGALSLGALAAAGVFAVAPPGDSGLFALSAVSLAAGSAYFAVVATVFGLAAAAEGREPWWHGWWSRFAWVLPHYALCGFAGGMLAVAYERADVYALAAFAVPLLAIRETHSVFLGHAEKSAEQVRDAEEKIQTQTLSLDRVNRLLRDRSAAALESLNAIVEARDENAAGRARRIREYALLIGRELGLSEAELTALGHAALLHDIGKLCVPESILLKRSPLTAEEWLVMVQHADAGARVVERLGFLDDAVAAIKYHHERWDGTGYPERLRGESIPLEARIIQVAEAYDSMVTNPTYRPTRTEQEALDELHRLAGKQFCPRCVGAFERALVGTAVRTAVAEPATSA